MSIRARLTFWYTGILLAAFLFIGGWAYYEFIEKQTAALDGVPNARSEPAWEEAGEILLYGGAPALVLALVGGWFLMRRALAPVAQLTEAVERVHAGHLRERLPCPGNGDELDRLTQVFNEMTQRLSDSFQHMREFTLHASHELKTPLTVMHGELETALREEFLSPAEHDRFASLLDEVRRLMYIIEGLTFLAKADMGQMPLEKSPVRLDDLVREACADAQTLALPRQIKVNLERCDAVAVAGDRRRLRQLLLIVTDNAVKYNYREGIVSLSLVREDERARLVITNTGPGVPPPALERVFDRFFRSDSSHSKEVDGCGLGLSIARWIVNAHSGEIHLASELDKHTEVTILLPAIFLKPTPAPSRLATQVAVAAST